MTSGFSGYGDGVDSYNDYNSYADGEFEEFLWSYIEIDGFFYTYSGELLGDKNYMYEVFEDNRYRRHWESVDYNSPSEDYRMSFEDWEYKN
jgi:hypothetical protein